MADWTLPTTGSKYVDYTAQLNARLNDLAYGLDPAVTSASNVLTNFQRWSSANARWEKYNGSSWVALASAYAINITGSAATLTTPRAIALSGDATGTANFDGSAGITIAATLTNSGVSAGSYGGGNAIPQITFDAKGRATGVTTVAVTPVWTNITSKPTTVSGYGITDAVSNTGGVPSIQSGLASARPAAGTNGRLYLATDTFAVSRDNGTSWDTVTPAYTGDVTKAAGGTALTLATIAGLTAGAYTKVTINTKGQVTSAANLASSDVTTALGFTPYNATNPDGYITSSALSSYMPKSGGSFTGNVGAPRFTNSADALNRFEQGIAVLRSSVPTMYFRDTDSQSGMIQVNSNRMYFLSGGIDTEIATQNNGYWPMYLELDTNNAVFGASVSAVGDITAFSDESIKTDWADLPEDFIAQLAAVKHGTYTRKDIGTRQVGVSAQSLKPVMPEAVAKNSNGIFSVSYGNAALTACVELAKEVVAIREELKTLKGAA